MTGMTPFWEGLERGAFVVQRCRECGTFRFPARARCLSCGSSDADWQEASTAGTVYSTTTVNRAVFPDIPPPYDVVVCQMEIGITFFARAENTLPIGSRADLRMVREADSGFIPFFVAADRDPADAL